MINEQLLLKYGVYETNPIDKGYHDVPIVGTLDWTSPDLVKVTRLRLVSDPGFPSWDVSYCHGVNKNGERVNVALPFFQIPKGNIKGFIIAEAKRDKIYAKGLGILDCISTLL